MTSPQEAHSLVGHSPAQKEDIVLWLRNEAAAFTNLTPRQDFRLLDAADEIDRLRTALRAVRASTDPKWVAQIISDALREGT